jgi:hypothetical protein
MADSLHTVVERERKLSAPEGYRWEHVKEFRAYARGRNKATLNADQVRIMAGVLKHKFSDNVLKMILNAHANRLRVARFDVADVRVQEFIFETWVKNSFPDLFTDAIFATLRDGNHVISINWLDDPSSEFGGRIVLTRERWWDGKEGVFVMYGDDARPAYAVKEWTPLGAITEITPGGRGVSTKGKRRNIYFPDRIYRFVWNGGEWEPYSAPEDTPDSLAKNKLTGEPMAGVLDWTKQDGSGIGIPIVHFPNGSDDDSLYGASLLDGGALAFQDQINAIQHDITAASMLNGSPQTFSSGFELPKDEQTEKEIPIVTGPGIHHHSSEEGAKWGVIEGGNLAQLKEAYFLKLEAVCRITNTARHSITGEWPSGEALYQATLPEIAAARKLGESVGPALSTLMHRCTEIANVFGGLGLDENSLITTVFEPPDLRDPLANWSIAEKAAPFVGDRETLRLAGYKPEQIEKIMAEKEKDAKAALSVAQSAFNRPADLDALQSAAGRSLEDDDEEEGAE